MHVSAEEWGGDLRIVNALPYRSFSCLQRQFLD